MKVNFLQVDFFNRITIKKVLKKAQRRLDQPDNIELTVSFVSEAQIKEINGQYRGVDSVTDVLSFPSQELKPFERVDFSEKDKDPYSGNILLGDIIICKARAQEQATAYGHSLKREIAFLALHGFLHLCGFDHVTVEGDKQMQSVAESVLASLNIKR